MPTRIVIAAVAAVAMTACGGGTVTQQTLQSTQPAQTTPQTQASAPAAQAEQPPAAQAAQNGQQAAQAAQQVAQQGTQQLAQGLQQLAQGLSQMGQHDANGKAVEAVDFEKLVALLPSPAGWTKSKPTGKQVTAVISTSNAEASYTKGPMNVRLEITDSAFSQLLLAPLSMMLAAGYSERSSDGYKKSVSMSGSPAYEEWGSDTKQGEVTALVANRFIVSAKGSSLDSIDSLRTIVNQVDLNKLAAMK
jgi:hypothetical protein